MLPPTGGGRAPAERLARLAPCIGCRPAASSRTAARAVASWRSMVSACDLAGTLPPLAL